jgi:hypothetical protein
MSAVSVTNTPNAALPETVEQHVQRLLAIWRKEMAVISSSTVRAAHPAYRELIALGPPALPFLFRDLEQTRDGHLSRALVEITGARPIPGDERGQVRAIADHWLNWARENGYRW